jgi:mono/diheme cytochrome c family protein
MKKLFFLTLVILTSCTAAKLMTPAQSDVDRVSTKYPGYTLADLNQGKMLFEQTCSQCHKLKDPTSRNEDKWKKIVPAMITKLDKKEGKQAVTDDQQALILKYLVTMSTGPKPAK